MAAYDITQLKSLEHDTSLGYYNSLIQIDATHFILAYQGVDDDGFIKTFSIDGSYNITQLKSLEHDTSLGYYNSLIQIDATHFILAYTGLDDDGFIKTFSIDGSYNITQIASLEHDTVQCYHNSLVKIDDTHFILAYASSGADGYIKTFSIDGSYNITQIASLKHDASFGRYNSLVKIDDTHFILAYTGSDNGLTNDGYIKTFSIDGSYNITAIDTFEHDTSDCQSNSLVKIDDTHFILAYAGSGTDGFIKTFSIDGSYNITQLKSLEHDTGYGHYNSLVKIDDTHFILAYAGPDTDGFIKTFSIDGSYNITEINTLEHDTVQGTDNSLVKIDDTHFILAYASSDNYGYIKTFFVETPVVAPTVTTQAVSSIDKTTATGNGNITDTGGINPHLRGIAYIPGNSGDISFIPLINPSFEDATLGWAGAGTLARSSEQAKYGTYSMKVTWTSGGEGYGEVHPTPATYSGKKVTFGCWVWASVANIACLNIYDNAGAGYEAVQSDYHPGDSTWRFLTVSKTLRGSLTDLILRCRIITESANSAYFDGALVSYSDSVSPTLAFDNGDYGTGAFTKALSNLIPNTDYRATAFAQNSVGIANGVTVGFTTLKADESNFLLFM